MGETDAKNFVAEKGKDEAPSVPAVPHVTVLPVRQREKTLSDFSPRDMIKHLYGLGYRIENNQLVCIVRQVVKISDILNG